MQRRYELTLAAALGLWVLVVICAFLAAASLRGYDPSLCETQFGEAQCKAWRSA